MPSETIPLNPTRVHGIREVQFRSFSQGFGLEGGYNLPVCDFGFEASCRLPIDSSYIGFTGAYLGFLGEACQDFGDIQGLHYINPVPLHPKRPQPSIPERSQKA